MRLIGAGLFVCAGLLAMFATADALGVLNHAPPWIIGGLMGVAVVGLVVAAAVLFNRPGPAPLDAASYADQVRTWEQQGLLESTEYRATRALFVDESEDEGVSYFLELVDGRVLFLSGQYLYEYEPDDDEHRVRVFPCSEFSIRRHKQTGDFVDMRCGGNALEPEAVARPFNADDWDHGRVPEDGEVITARTYEAIKREQLSR